MNVPTKTVLVVCTFLIIVLNSPRLINAHNCTTVKDEKGILENCSYRGLILDVPQDLDPGVTEIDLSGNIMRNIATERGFGKYTHLKILRMRNMTRTSPFSKSQFLFKNVYSLEVIDFSYTFDDDSKPLFDWPPNIRIIYCSNNVLKDLGVGNLKKLEKLYASDNPYMEDFPIFHDVARITVLDLKGNTLIQDQILDGISKLCHLENLNITVNMTSSWECECVRLNRWANFQGIQMSSELPCARFTASLGHCNTKFSEKHQSNRRACVNRGGSSHMNANWYYVLPLIMIIVLALLIPSYLYAKKYRTAHHKLRRRLKLAKASPVVTGTEDSPIDEEENTDEEAQNQNKP